MGMTFCLVPSMILYQNVTWKATIPNPGWCVQGECFFFLSFLFFFLFYNVAIPILLLLANGHKRKVWPCSDVSNRTGLTWP